MNDKAPVPDFNMQAADITPAALEMFRYQYRHNALYRAYTDALHIQPEQVQTLTAIPFLPIQFFKTHTVVCGSFTPELVFESSGTTQTVNSRHLVKDAGLYARSFMTAFELFYGPVTDYVVVGLLPSYLERQHSSLVVMVQEMIQRSGHAGSGFYLYEHERLYAQLQELEARGQKVLLIGVTFGLLDFAEQYQLHLQHTIVMETGGMKGRRKEMIREELHQTLCKGFGIDLIHSEYGMTELLSQAYSNGNGIFNCPPWMKIITRDTNDPMTLLDNDKTGGINVIDLANINSCSFIATQDLGRIYKDGSFEVLGRFDNSDIRGCNLLIA